MSEPIEPSTMIARAPGIIAEELGGELVMLNPEQDSYLRLNLTGRLLWERLAEPATVESLARELERHAGIPAARADADALAFARNLVSRGAATADGG